MIKLYSLGYIKYLNGFDFKNHQVVQNPNINRNSFLICNRFVKLNIVINRY